MAIFTGQTPSATYGCILNVGVTNGQIGLSNVLQQIQDAYGNSTPLTVSTIAFNISRSGYTFSLDSVAVTAQAADINSMCNPNPIALGTGSFTLPIGTTAERPVSPVNGELRYNTTINDLEAYSGGSWTTFGGLVSVTGTANQIVAVGDPNVVLSLAQNISGIASITTTDIQIGVVSADTIDTISTNPINFTCGVNLRSGNALRLYDTATNLSYTALAAPAVPTNVTFYLPAADGTAGQILKTNGAGVMSWTSVGTGSVTSVAVTGSTGLVVGGSPITSSGTITLTLGAELQALSGLGSTGLVARTGASTYAEVSIAGTANRISVTNGNAVAGNPTIDISATYVGQTSITTLGTIGTGTWQGSVIGLAYGGTNANLTASNGGIFYSTASAAAILAGNASANRVLLSGASAAPTWSTASYLTSTTANQLLYSSANDVIAGLATANNGVLITSGAGVPSISSTLPAAVLSNITTVGTITSGVWQGTPITVPYGGTGNTTFTAYSVICAGTIGTGTFQNVVGVGTAGYALISNGAMQLPSWQAVVGTVSSVSGTANQIDVSPTTGACVVSIDPAYVGQTSITTLGTIATGTWHGSVIPLAYGGTNANLTASNGGIFYSTASASAILAGTATANRILLSGSSTTPAWSTATYPATTTANQILYSSSNDVIAGLASAANGVLITSAGSVPSISSTLPTAVQTNITTVGTIASGTWASTAINVAYGGTGDISFTPYSVICGGVGPTTALQNVSGVGSSGYVLTSNGAGTLPTWQVPTTGSGTVNSGTQYQLAYYANTGTTVSGLSSAANGILITSGASVPSISSTLPSAVQANITTTGALASGSLAAGFTPVTVPLGGTGNTTFTAYSIICGGTTPTGTLQNVVGVGTSGYALTSNGAGALPTWQAVAGAVTSVTGTANQIDVSPTTGNCIVSIDAAYVGQTSITTLGTIATGTWHGSVIPLAYGGTNANLTASNGGIFYSTGSAGAILAGNASANTVLLSGASAAPTWSAATYPVTTTVNQILYSSSSDVISGLATAVNGTLITSGAGVPSISSTLPTAVQGNITATGALASGSLAAGFTPVTVPLGGTGNTTFTAYSLICAGTTPTGTFQNVSGVGTAGQVLTSAGAGALPAWQSAASGAALTDSITQTAHGFTVQQLVYLSGASTFALAKADNIATAEVIGMVTAVGGANTFTLATSGYITGLSGLTAATVYWLSDATAGLLTATAPTTPGNIAKPVLIADTTTSGYFINFRGEVIPAGFALPVSLANGGTNANLTASNGGIFYSTASAGAILAGTATAGLFLLSGSTTAPTWSNIVPGNAFANNWVNSSTSTVSAGGTTTLTSASNQTQILTGSSNQTYKLPDETTLTVGTTFSFNNNSSGTITIEDSGSNVLYYIPAGGYAQLNCLSISSANAGWDAHFFLPSNASAGSNIMTISSPLNVIGALAIEGGNTLELYNAAQTFYAGLKAGAMASNITWTWPLVDGANGQILTTNGSGTLSFSNPTSGLIVNQTSSSATLAAGKTYICNNGVSLITYTLPTTAALGDTYQIIGGSSGGWIVAQNASQQMHSNSSATAPGATGSLASTNAYNCLTIICTTTNNGFTVIADGSLTIV